jgi:hypothetical protein
LFGESINDENWSVLCESLKAHHTLTSLDLRDTNPIIRTTRNELTEDHKAHRTRVLAEMMKVEYGIAHRETIGCRKGRKNLH